MIKQTITAAFLLTIGAVVRSQNNVGGAGGDISGDGSASFSVAQTFYQIESGSSQTVLQGVQQPFEIQTVLGVHVPYVKLRFAAYPNPVQTTLSLEIEGDDRRNICWQLYDLNGRLLQAGLVTERITDIPMAQFASASYLLKTFSLGTELKTFKILKSN